MLQVQISLSTSSFVLSHVAFLLGWRLHGFGHLSGIWPPKWHFGGLLVGWAASEFSLAEVGVLIWSLGHFELATTIIKFVW